MRTAVVVALDLDGHSISQLKSVLGLGATIMQDLTSKVNCTCVLGEWGGGGGGGGGSN